MILQGVRILSGLTIWLILLFGLCACVAQQTKPRPTVAAAAPINPEIESLKRQITDLQIEISQLKNSSEPASSSSPYVAVKETSTSGLTNNSAFIYLPHPPVTESQKNTYLIICQSWQAEFPTKAEYSTSALSQYTSLPLRWLVKNQSAPQETCPELIEAYDYASAQAIAIKWNLQRSAPSIVLLRNNKPISFKLAPLSQEQIPQAMFTWSIKLSRRTPTTAYISNYDLVESARRVLGALSPLLFEG